jgi:hypothetical protein
MGGSNTTQVAHYFTFIDNTLEARTWHFDLLIVGRHVDHDKCAITRVIGGRGCGMPDSLNLY